MDESNEAPINQIGPSGLESVSVLSYPSPASNFRTPEQQQQQNCTTTTTATTETSTQRNNLQTDDVVGPQAVLDHTNIHSTAATFREKSPSAFRSNLPLTPEINRSVRLSEQQYEQLQDEGYDSDGLPPPYDANDGVEADPDDELPLGTLPDVNIAMEGREIAEDDVFVDIFDSNLSKMSTIELKTELKKRGIRGLSNKSKSVLLDMLKVSIQNSDPVLVEQHKNDDMNTNNNSNSNNNNQPAAINNNTINIINKNRRKKSNDLAGLATSAYWQLLVPEEIPVKEPSNVADFRAPTIPEGDHAIVPIKYNFSDRFDRPVFVGKKEVPKFTRQQKLRYSTGVKTEKALLFEETLAEEGGPKMSWIRSNNLSMDSTPADWFHAFLPSRRSAAEEKKFHSNMWCKFTNQKANIANAGVDCYPDFKPFTPREIEKHLAVYFVNGLNPSPQVEMKFRQQAHDPIQGNDFIWKQMGPGAKARHRHFKAFFCIQDPMKPVPTRKENPLHKVNSFLRWIQQVSQAAWKLGRDIAGDEQTIGFQGNHADKRRITYKAEGDGFQCDAICDRGFTYNFYFRNMPPPLIYIQKGWSPLHARMLSLFDCLDEKYHRVWMDNLY